MIDKILSKLPPRGTPQYVRTKRITLIVAAILLLGLPWVVTNKYYIHILISVGLYSILALSLNLVTGYAGQLSFCHVAFYGIGAYTGGLLMLRLGVSFWLAILAGALMAAFFGLILGLPTLRLRGDYLAIVTLGFGEIVHRAYPGAPGPARHPQPQPVRLSVQRPGPLLLFDPGLPAVDPVLDAAHHQFRHRPVHAGGEARRDRRRIHRHCPHKV